MKVELLPATAASTLSVSHAVVFGSLLLLGAHEAMIVAAASAFIVIGPCRRSHASSENCVVRNPLGASNRS